METPEFNAKAAHRHFSTNCFNQAWELIEKPDRTPAEDEEMIRLAQAALWHWTQRDDCSDKNMSIGYWQLSRIYTLLNQPEDGRRYAKLCLDHSRKLKPFYLAYAHEALARVESRAGNRGKAEQYLRTARSLAGQVKDLEEKELLQKDLETID